jgi:DNA-binding NarL/FixJ family response regulator
VGTQGTLGCLGSYLTRGGRTFTFACARSIVETGATPPAMIREVEYSSMSRAIPLAPVQVCSIAQNRLVEAYLEQLLHKDHHLRQLSLEQYTGLSPITRRNTVFVLDQSALQVPLCECLRQLRDGCSNAKFIVLDDEKSKEEIVRLLVVGAHGYVSHADVSCTLIPAIVSVAGGQLWVPQDVFQQFLLEIGRVLRRDNHPRQSTTRREDEILELVRRRLSNREIADFLRIRVSTVKFHLSNIFSKMHANNRRDLIEPPSAKLRKYSPQ